MSSDSRPIDPWLERVILEVEKEIRKWSPALQHALPSNRRADGSGVSKDREPYSEKRLEKRDGVRA